MIRNPCVASDALWEVVSMKHCSVCGEIMPVDVPAGEVCQMCVDSHDDWGVYFCLGSEDGGST